MDIDNECIPQPNATITNSDSTDKNSKEQLTVSASNAATSTHLPLIPASPPTVVTNITNKTLPNIQPKLATPTANGIPKAIVPKNDGKLANPTAPAPAGNVLVPQGIQHVLINGQLYPIIQTANGTHLLIQQPVGQIQQNGGAPQVFTAQPIQLGNTATVNNPGVPSLPVTSQSTGSGASNQIKAPIISSPSKTTLVNQSINTTQQQPVTSTSMMSSAALTQTTTSTSTVSTSSANQIPSTNFKMQLTIPNLPTSSPVTVSPQTQQVLSRIQTQIDILKPKMETDPSAKQSVLQLQHIQQQIFNQIRQHVLNAQQKIAADQTSSTQTISSQPAITTPSASNIPQTTVQQNSPNPPANTQQHGYIIQPAKGNESPMTSNNIMSLIAAFMNVKVGAQLYNIQLSEEQKSFMIERMCKMNPDQQRSFVQQQQVQILSNAFRAQPPAPVSSQSTAPATNLPGTPPTTEISQSSSPKPQPKSRSKRRPTPRKPDTPTPSPASSNTSQPQTSTPPPPNSKSKPPAPKRPRYTNFSSKKIGERMLSQIQKDQEVLLKPGSHKKPFHTKSQLSERLLRYHIYYTDDSAQAARRMQEADLFNTIAHKLVLKKEEMMRRFRDHLWKDSVHPHRTVDDRLITEFLLEDEKQAVIEDRDLELEDIEHFKSLYTQPEKPPTPPPPPSPVPPSPEPVIPSPKPSPPSSRKKAPKATVLLKRCTQPQKSQSDRPTRGAASRRRARQVKQQADISHEEPTVESIGTEPPEELTSVNNHVEANAVMTRTVTSPNADVDISIDDSVDNVMVDENLDRSPVEDISPSPKPDSSSSESDHISESEDEEDDIIDIGVPPTPPPIEPLQILPQTPSVTFKSPPFSSPRKQSLNREDSVPTSPRQYFSICSETVVEQSEQMDQSHHSIDSSYSTHVSADEDSLSDVEETNYQATSPIDNQEGVTPEVDAPAAMYEHTIDFREQESNFDYYKQVEENASKNGGDHNSMDYEEVTTENESQYEEWDEEGDNGPVESEDKDSEEDSGSEQQMEEEDTNTVDDNEDGRENKVIAPLRISKHQLNNYDWRESSRYREASPPPIKLKISEPTPPPIRLRIKRDQNDTWEAASSISSYGDAEQSEQELSGDEDLESEEEEVANGGVAVNWDDASTRESGSSEEEDEYGSYSDENLSSLDTRQYNVNSYNSQAEDNVPFGNYSHITNVDQEEEDDFSY